MTSAKRGVARTLARAQAHQGLRGRARARVRWGPRGRARSHAHRLAGVCAVRDHRSSKLIDTGLRRGGRGFTVRGISCEDAGVGAAGGGLAGPHALCV